MTKRIIALLLASIMVLGLLAGCGNESAPTDPPKSADGDVSTTNPPPAEEKHDPVTLHYYVFGWPGQEDADAVYAKANEMIQEIYPWITVEFHVSEQADFATHVALAQAAGDPIDVISTFPLDYASEMANGAFMDVTD